MSLGVAQCRSIRNAINACCDLIVAMLGVMECLNAGVLMMETSSDSRLDLAQANCFAAMPSLVIVGCCANLTGKSMCMVCVHLDS